MTLRTRLQSPTILLAPGCYDGLSALMIQQAGFEAAYVSGASVAYTRFGLPDIGLVGMTEMADTIAAIRTRCTLPLIVDADTGFGNALNVQRTVRAFAAAGADAIQLEDQTFPKRCGHLSDKTVVSASEMVGKIKAAVDARPRSDLLIIARTDAIAVEGLASALDRAEAYVQAGADVLFVEAPPDPASLQAIVARFGGRVPLLANMVEGGLTPLRSATALEELGYSVAIFPGALVRAFAAAAAPFLLSLKQNGTTEPMRDSMLDFAGLNAVLGTPDILAQGRRYEEELP